MLDLLQVSSNLKGAVVSVGPAQGLANKYAEQKFLTPLFHSE